MVDGVSGTCLELMRCLNFVRLVTYSVFRTQFLLSSSVIAGLFSLKV